MKKSSFIIGTVFGVVLTATSVFALSPPIVTFSDVPSGHWSMEALDWAVNNNFVEGYKDNTFRGDNPTSRYETAQLFYNYDQMMQSQMEKIEEMEEQMKVMRNEIIDLKLASEAGAPIDSSELLPGGTSYLVCKSEEYAWFYTSSSPTPNYEAKFYDAEGNLIDKELELVNCFRTTKTFWESKVNE